jgi:hypothetical protein
MSRASPCSHAAGDGCGQHGFHGMHGDTKYDLFRKHAWRSLRDHAAGKDGTRVCCMNASTMHTASAAQCSPPVDSQQVARSCCYTSQRAGHATSSRDRRRTPCNASRKERQATEELRKRQHPTLSAASTLAPLSSSRRATSRLPFRHACQRAVNPCCRCSKAPHMQP